MVVKVQWVVPPYLVAKELPELSLIPTGVKEERDQRPRWIVNNIYSNLNT